MPALCAHPAAAVPLRRYGLSLSALIIGSMTPDFLYFFRISTNAQFGHTFTGVFVFCLPAGLFAFGLFHRVLKIPLFSLLPQSHQECMSPFLHHVNMFSSGKHLLLVMLAVFLGAWTHILWDSCTHEYGWAVRYVFLLRIPLLHTSHGTLRVYKVLQHGGTLCGTALLVLWYWRWFTHASKQTVPTSLHLSTVVRTSLILCILGIAGLSGMCYGLYAVPKIIDVESFSSFVVYSSKVSFAVLCLDLFIFSASWHIFTYQTRCWREQEREL